MEIKNFVKLASAALVVGSFASCQDYEPFDEATVAASVKAREYTDNFEALIGEFDPNHNWGFYELIPSQGSNAGVTRANGSAGDINVNRNQWAALQTDNMGTHYIAEAIAKDVKIPGYPNFDDYYYVSNKGDESLYTIVKDQPDGQDLRPIGDVTEYEIQYVSAWFRTHKIEDPTKYRENLHLSDFFIQNVSADHDQLTYSSLPTGTYTGKNGENINDASEAVAAGLTNVTLSAGTQTQQLEYPLDFLCFKPIGASDKVDNTWTHVNDYNAQANNWNPEEKQSNTSRTIMYITSSGTEDFACRASFNTNGNNQAPSGDDFLYDWVLIRLTWMEPGYDGIVRQREGYYLAFDYAAEKAECKVEGDNYYSNWIVKITPANFSEESPSLRVMCEDLGNTFDFDFNDVVFDVRYEKTAGTWDNDPANRFTAIISLQAAGGTLPIYVGVNPSAKTNEEMYEAHNMMGNTAMTPINVGVGPQHNVAIYRIEDLTSSNPDDIPVYVKYGDKGVRSVAKANRGNINDYDNNPKNPQAEITDATAPQKFAVPITTKWMKELEFIVNGYPEFAGWAANPDNNTDWYDHPSSANAGKIYTPTITQNTENPTIRSNN